MKEFGVMTDEEKDEFLLPIIKVLQLKHTLHNVGFVVLCFDYDKEDSLDAKNSKGIFFGKTKEQLLGHTKNAIEELEKEDPDEPEDF